MGITPVVGEIIGPDILIILAILLVLFGGAKIPKLARSLGQASHEFRKGMDEGVTEKAIAALTKEPSPPVQATVTEPAPVPAPTTELAPTAELAPAAEHAPATVPAPTADHAPATEPAPMADHARPNESGPAGGA